MKNVGKKALKDCSRQKKWNDFYGGENALVLSILAGTLSSAAFAAATLTTLSV